MAWTVRESPHWLVRWACGHVKAECACSRKGGKREIVLGARCPGCSVTVDR